MAFAVYALAQDARRRSGDTGVSRDLSRHLNMFYGAAISPITCITELLKTLRVEPQRNANELGRKRRGTGLPRNRVAPLMMVMTASTEHTVKMGL